jgi:hypothetical protein
MWKSLLKQAPRALERVLDSSRRFPPLSLLAASAKARFSRRQRAVSAFENKVSAREKNLSALETLVSPGESLTSLKEGKN